MSVIFQRTFTSDGNRQGLTLGNEDFVRPLSIGSNWNSLRIGISCAIRPDGVNDLGGTYFSMGLCSLGGHWGSASSNFFGACFSQSSGPPTTFAYQAGTNGNAYFSQSYTVPIKKLGTTRTYGTYGTGSYWPVAGVGQNGPRRTIAGVVITKGAPNFSVAYSTRQVANGATDETTLQLLEWGETQTIQGAAVTPLQTSLAFDESQGLLTCVNLFWPKAVIGLFEFYGLVVARVS